MIELAKHIEILLLDNDCVIVPDLGGFIAHCQPARYEENEGMFLPPVRTVGFNPQLTMNDGVLVQSYMQACHTDYTDALRIISGKVAELKEKLYEEGVVKMQGIGALHYTIYDTYEFHPCENGILSPSLYALEAFAISPLSAETSVTEQTETVKPDILTEFIRKKPDELHLTPHWWSHAVAVAVAVILFFTLSAPVENTYVDKGIYASLGTDCLFDAIRTQSVATTLFAPEMEDSRQKKEAKVVPVAVKVEKVSPAPHLKEVAPENIAPKEVKKMEKAVQPVKKKAVPVSRTEYHIIVASLTTALDAQRMLGDYQRQGYADAAVIESKGRFRISLNHYADKQEAYTKLNELKKDDAFKQAWMLTSK